MYAITGVTGHPVFADSADVATPMAATLRRGRSPAARRCRAGTLTMTGWTAACIPDQHGRRVVVTGASSGLGAEVSRVLAEAGATVVMACRDPVKAGPIARAIGGDVQVRELDLADLGSVRAFAEGLEGDIDVLVNNAGVMAVPESTTADGFELHLGTNHLGPFALTGLLINRIHDRVVTVTSGLHVLGRIDADLDGHQRYGRWRAYARSKLANALFGYELHRRLCAAGRVTRSVVAHPGVAATEGQRADRSLLGRILAGGPAQSPPMGALPILYAATASDVESGTCIGPDGFMQRKGHPAVVRTSRASRDTVTAAGLWRRSEDLTAVRYAIEPR